VESNPAGLADEVGKFNGFAETGMDLDFNRGGDDGAPSVSGNNLLIYLEKTG